MRALIPRLLAERPDLRLVLFVRRRDLASTRVAYSTGRSNAGRIDVRHISHMPAATADVFWYPWNEVGPLPRRGALVVTIHDIAPIVLPDPRRSRWFKNWMWRRRYRASADRATLLIADSQFTADEVRRVLGVADGRVRVVHLAADDAVIPLGDDDVAVVNALRVTRPYILAVGARDTRKNLVLVDRAMAELREQLPALTLALAGPGSSAKRDAGHFSRTLGFVTERQLTALYRMATCLVVPSRYEGFGLPLLEAMQLGTPVVCARTSSLPEIGGDAVAWVDPDDASELAAAVARVALDTDWREELRSRGLRQASRFRWDETARRTLAVFDEAIRLHADG